ncbi:MAG TPA: hypothetical protein DIW31_01205 [Bacteroidales bacterium]|nr:hypothetical protein [Bacteroidales bacterium]
MEKPHVSLLKLLLKKSNVKVNEDEFEFQLLSHPSYPSLHSITGVLDHFSIKNYALEIPKSFEALALLPSNFLAFIKTDDYSGFVLASKQEFGFQLFFDDSKKQVMLFNNFLDAWTGVIVIIEDEVQEIKHDVKKARFSNVIFYIVPIVLLAISFYYKATLFQTTHLLLSIIGAVICILIVQHEMGLHSVILEKFCSQENKRTSCDAVLNSKGATLFKVFKFSDIGIIYFASLIFSWILVTISKTSFNPIVLITGLAIPFTFFSIFYQYKVVKKWCLLCLSVVLVLWLQATSLLFLDLNKTVLSLSVESLTLTAFSFFASFALWQFISPRLKKEQELRTLKIDHFKFKRNFNIFKSLIARTEKINTTIENIHELVLGNTSNNSPIEIVVITNPLCGFCKEAHKLVENLLLRADYNIRIIIRFNVSTDFNSTDTKIAMRLIEIYSKESEQKCLEALHDIYSNYNPTDWLQKWGEALEIRNTHTIVKAKEWCKQNNINFTPEILVNGKSFPSEYNRTDLIFFIDDLIDEQAEKIEVELINQEIEN